VAKDLDLACQLAREVGAPSRIGAIADEVLKRAQAQGWGPEGYAIVAKILEETAGTQLRTGVSGGGSQSGEGYQTGDPRRA
jgi:3-hydroxyisobutyrate dehydrogenase-like beta-hydroxyacid dehydrogenase